MPLTIAIAIAANAVRQFINCESMSKIKELGIRNWGLAMALAIKMYYVCAKHN